MVDASQDLSTSEIVKRYKAIHDEMNRWARLSGQDLCWYHPERLAAIARIMDIPVHPTSLCPRGEFEKGCTKYQDLVYNKK